MSSIAIAVTLSQSLPLLGSLPVPVLPPDVEAMADGTVEFTLTGTGALVTLTVSAPAAYAGSYEFDPALLETGPVNLVAPVVTGTPDVAETLSLVPGLWVYGATDPDPVPVHAWQADTGGDGTFADIAGASASAYIVAAGDAGNQLRVVETLAVPEGARQAVAAPVAIPAPATFDPAALFETGAAGVWLDLTDPATLFSDLAGTVPVAADGDIVRHVAAKAGSVSHFALAGASEELTYRTDGTRHWVEFDTDIESLRPAGGFVSGATTTMYVGLTAEIAAGVPAMIVHDGGGSEYAGRTFPGAGAGVDGGLLGTPGYRADGAALPAPTMGDLHAAWCTGAPVAIGIEDIDLSALALRIGTRSFTGSVHNAGMRLYALIIREALSPADRSDVEAYLQQKGQ